MAKSGGRDALARSAAIVLLVGFVLSPYSAGQRGGLNDPRPLQDFSVSYQTAPGTGVLIFSVFSERTSRQLDRQALLKLVDQRTGAAMWQTTEDTSKAVFTNIPYGSYDAEISAVGYVSEHKELHVMNSLRPAEMEIVLHRDPNAVNLDVADAVMSPKARKEAKNAILDLKSRRWSAAEKQLGLAYKLAPTSADVNFLLGYLYFEKKDYAQAGTYLDSADHLRPHHGATLTLLGHAQLERDDYPAARSALEQAVLADADNWLPHSLLADAYLHQRDYGKAQGEAQIAVEKGKSAASAAQLVLGEAFIGQGRDQDAVRTLNTFLQESPRHPLAGQVRSLIAEISDKNLEASVAPRAPVTETVPAVDPLAAMPGPSLVVKSWQPPGVDEIKPAIAAEVACPSGEVVEQSGKRVQELVNDVARFAAMESLFHQSLDAYGIPVRTEERKYNYVATITEPQPGVLMVDEDRVEKLTLDGYPDHIASSGFTALALVFHPDMRDNFEMTCEGLGDWRGQATWLVHFLQREDRPNRMHNYKVGNQLHSVGLRGRAWITADHFQIVRIEAEMTHPMPEIQLLSEHQVVEYGPVPFAKKNTTLWLPKSAEIYFDFRKHHYYRRHSFDHFMLFAVDADEKRKEPTAPKPQKE